MKLVVLLLLLYFLQGVPYGFQTKFLPVYLRSYSLSLTLISFTRLLSLPWLLKPFWAPLVDTFGAKISWVKYNLFGMALCYMVASCMSMNSVSCTLIVVACLNIMAATQDIAVDSLFVDNLTPEEIGEFYFCLHKSINPLSVSIPFIKLNQEHKSIGTATDIEHYMFLSIS